MTRRLVLAFGLAAGLAIGASACGKAGAAAPVTEAIAACPDGAVLNGSAPPEGLRQRCQLAEGVRHGASREWWPDGRERSYSEWWRGDKHGQFALYFDNGQLRSTGAHVHGKPAGLWRTYDRDGIPQQLRMFELAPPAGDWLAQAIAGRPPVDPAVHATR